MLEALYTYKLIFSISDQLVQVRIKMIVDLEAQHRLLNFSHLSQLFHLLWSLVQTSWKPVWLGDIPGVFQTNILSVPFSILICLSAQLTPSREI